MAIWLWGLTWEAGSGVGYCRWVGRVAFGFGMFWVCASDVWDQVVSLAYVGSIK